MIASNIDYEYAELCLRPYLRKVLFSKKKLLLLLLFNKLAFHMTVTKF